MFAKNAQNSAERSKNAKKCTKRGQTLLKKLNEKRKKNSMAQKISTGGVRCVHLFHLWQQLNPNIIRYMQISLLSN